MSASELSRDAEVVGGAHALSTSDCVVLIMAAALIGGTITALLMPGTWPIAPDAALSLGALALGAVGMATQQRLLVALSGAFAGVIGATVVLEYASDLSAGSVGWALTAAQPLFIGSAERMALPTAASFFFSGSALLVAAFRADRFAVIGIFNSITLSLALTSLIGSLFQFTDTLPDAMGTSMPIYTSIPLLLYACAMLGFAWTAGGHSPDTFPKWVAGISVAVLPVTFFGVAAVLPTQRDQAALIAALVSVACTALLGVAMHKLSTARVAVKGGLIIVAPLMLLLAFTGLVTQLKARNQSEQALALHSDAVLSTSQQLLSDVTESESAVRSYMLTRNRDSIEPFNRLLESSRTGAAALRAMVSDNPLQEAGAKRIEANTTLRMGILSQAVVIVAAADEKAIAQLIARHSGAVPMRDLRSEMVQFNTEEHRLADQRRESLASSWQQMTRLLVSGTAGAILLASLLAIAFSAGITRRLKSVQNNALRLAKGQPLLDRLGGIDEIAELDHVFHDMAHALALADHEEKILRQRQERSIDVKHSEALLKTGALQSAIFNSANFSSIATDATGVIQIFNVGAERMLGYTASEVTNTVTPAEISDPREVIARAAALSVELGTPITPGFEALVFKASRGIEDIYELTYIRKDGSRFPAIVSVTALRDAEEIIIGYLLIGTDNTARKHAEEALLEAGALQRAIFNSANFSSIATDEKGVIQIFNVGAERMLGYQAAEVVNRQTPADISDPQEVIARAAALSIELGTPITPGFEALVFKASRGIEDIYELTYIRKDGSRFPAIVSVTALRDAQEGIIGYLLIGTDNTARKDVEATQALLDQRLRDQQFYTRSLIESNIDALMMTDPRGIISDVNQQMIELTGRRRDELIGAPCRNFFTDPASADEAIKRVLLENKVSNYELTVRARNGTETVVSYNAATFHDRDQKLQGVFAAARDVTERRRFEIKLQENNIELVRASRMKSEFLATMSHELRTPLNAIIGFSEALKDGLMGETSAIQHEYIGDIFTSGQHLLSLINDILDLSKIEAGMMTLEIEAVDLNALLSASLSIVRAKAAAQHVKLTLDTDGLPGIYYLDMRKTKQIVYNLLSNAVKFSANGGSVTLRARIVTRALVGQMGEAMKDQTQSAWPQYGFALAENEYTHFLEISVIDGGIGISPDNMPKLFHSFMQIDSSLARKFEGTGLGLAMVKQLAELQGGTVAVASVVDLGTCFSTWLPVRRNISTREYGNQMVSLQQPAFPDAMARVALVIEDDDSAADLLRILLEAEGFKVLFAANAEAALEIAPGYALSLITLDLQLPGMSGWDFLLHLREMPSLAHVPVMIISGLLNTNFALAQGAAAVLEKPVSRLQLRTALLSLDLGFEPNVARTVLIVDDDPKAVEVIARHLNEPAYEVIRAYGGLQAIALAQQMKPDLILLDLLMPDVTGLDVIRILQADQKTASIPILVVTAKDLSAEDRVALGQNSANIIRIVEKASFDDIQFMIEVRRALLEH